MMIIGLGMQVKVLALAPDATDVAMALFSGIFNIGIGAGALVGNQVSLHWSMSMIGYVGAVPAFAALIWSIIIFRRWPSDTRRTDAIVERPIRAFLMIRFNDFRDAVNNKLHAHTYQQESHQTGDRFNAPLPTSRIIAPELRRLPTK